MREETRKRFSELKNIYCCAWCRGRVVAWLIWIPALLADKWPGYVGVWVVAFGLSYMAYRKHEKDRKERLKDIVGR